MPETQISTIFQTWPIFPGKTVRDIVKRFFFIVIYVFQLVFSRKILNHLAVKFSKNSILDMLRMSRSWISMIFQHFSDITVRFL